MYRLFIILLGAAVADIATAGIYKCEDDQGKLSYQSRPCNTDKQRQTVIQGDKHLQQAQPQAKPGNTINSKTGDKASGKEGATSDEKKEEKKKKTSNLAKYETERFVGTWCWYESIEFQQKVPASTTISLSEDGSYSWNDGKGGTKSGKWNLNENDILTLANIGAHTILKVTPGLIELQRHHVMKLRKGSC